MSEITPEQEDYFRTLANIDPSPEMARVIEQAKRDLANRSAGEGI